MPKKGKNDEIYTPKRVVKYILDAAEYVSSSVILNKHVMDNSCGNGQILVEVVDRYAQAYLDIHGNYDGLDNDIYKYVHGIEIKNDACEECRRRIAETVSRRGVGIDPDRIDIVCTNAFYDVIRTQYASAMDYVFGNPPYIRYRALSAEEKEMMGKIPMCGKGLADAYIAFFNLGIEMMKPDTGILSYITPSSWINSISGVLFRQYIRNHDILKSVFDLEHEQVFEGVMTYSMITVLEGRSRSVFDYYRFNKDSGEFDYIDRLRYNDAFIGNKLYLGTMNDLDFVRKVLTNINSGKCYTKNGIVTLSDKIFIDNLPDDIMFNIIKVVKASNGKDGRCMFPYYRLVNASTDKNGDSAPLDYDLTDVSYEESKNYTLMPLDEIKVRNPKLYDYIMENEAGLRARTYQPYGKDNWYGIGRSQGMKDIDTLKYAVPNLVKDENDVRFFKADSGVGVYGGMYAVAPADVINRKLVDEKENFFKFIRCLKHYKSGGYYTFTSVELEKYLNYEE